MEKLKSIAFSFVVAGVFGVIGQLLLALAHVVLPEGSPYYNTFMLIGLGVIGMIAAGIGKYQKLEEKATFGALIPFSGFAASVGAKMIKPSSQGVGYWKSVWQGLWLVIWFNVLAFLVSCGIAVVGFNIDLPQVTIPQATTGFMLYVHAFILGGLFGVIFQICYLLTKWHVELLMVIWQIGAILACFGISQALVAWGGCGFGSMIIVGGYSMYNVAVGFMTGEVAEALIHIKAFFGAVAGLFFTGWGTFIIYKAKFLNKASKTEVK